MLEPAIRSAELKTICELLGQQLEKLCTDRRIETVLRSMPRRTQALDPKANNNDQERWQTLADMIAECQERLSAEVASLASMRPSSHPDAMAYELHREYLMGHAILQILNAFFPVLDQIKMDLITHIGKAA